MRVQVRFAQAALFASYSLRHSAFINEETRGLTLSGFFFQYLYYVL